MLLTAETFLILKEKNNECIIVVYTAMHVYVHSIYIVLLLVVAVVVVVVVVLVSC